MTRSRALLALSAACYLSSGSSFLTATSPRHVTASFATASAPLSTNTMAGYADVDMNQYNLPMDQIVSEWTANACAETSMQAAGVFLGKKSKDGIFADTLQFKIKRSGGLGIQLLEIAGGREDGLGITIVDGLVDEGNAEGTGIVDGDSIIKLAVLKKTTNSDGGLLENEEELAVSTECLGYDATVDAIIGLPPLESEDEEILVTVKRLRRMPQIKIKLQYPPSQNEPDATLELFAGENLRRALLTRGVKLNDPLSRRFDSGGIGDCGAEGTCATCVVSVLKGNELLQPQGLQEAQILKENPRWRMACKTIIGYGMKEGDLTLAVNPRQWVE